MRLEKGQHVKWQSTSGGSLTEKRGVVVGIVNQFEEYRTALARNNINIKNYVDQYGGGTARHHESYLIEVASGKTVRSKPKLYWPMVVNLKKV